MSPRIIIALLAGLLAFATAAYGFGTTTHALMPQGGGAAGTPSGYTASNVHYVLSAADPRSISAVTFTLSPAASLTPGSVVEARLFASDGAYVRCTNTPASSAVWSCPISDVAVAEADQLAIRVGMPPAQLRGIWLPIIARPAP